MRNLMLAVVLVLSALVPLSASAQQRPAQAPSAPTLSVEGISSAKILAIGIGAVLTRRGPIHAVTRGSLRWPSPSPSIYRASSLRQWSSGTTLRTRPSAH